MNNTITVKNKKELAEMLMSGGEWEDIEYGSHCYYIESSINPFMAKRRDGDIMPMGVEWTTPQWRKVKYQPKENEVCIAWNDTETETAGIVVYEKGVSNAHNYAPYTGTIPPHIQKFLDKLEE